MTKPTLLPAGLVFILAALPGCKNTLPPAANADEARAALKIALDTWKSGGTSEALTQRTPPIYFNESKWQPDVRLISYAIRHGHEMYGQSVRLTVSLAFKRPDGTTKEREATYLVDTSPAIVIVPG